MAFVIRSPSGSNPRIPYIAVLGRRLPVAVVVEILSADDFARYITRGSRIVEAAVAAITPLVQIVRVADLLYFRIQLVGTAESSALSFMHRISLTVTCGLAFAVTNGHHRIVAVFAGFDAIRSFLKDGESLIRCVDFEH